MRIAVPLTLLVLGLAACTGQAGRAAAPPTGARAAAEPTAAAVQASAAAPPAAAAAPAPPAVTTAELDALARRIFPGRYHAGCGDLAACPVTDRLRARVEALSRPAAVGPGPVVQFCRCQNPASGMSVTSEPGASGGVAHVALVYGPTYTSRIDLVIVRTPDGRLLLDDTRCTGRGADTSIYAPALAGCGR
jgi:hypothetical protein